MSPTLQSLGIDRLSLDERMLLAEAIWDSVDAETRDAGLTAAQRGDLRARVARYEADPAAGSSWEGVVARLRAGS